MFAPVNVTLSLDFHDLVVYSRHNSMPFLANLSGSHLAVTLSLSGGPFILPLTCWGLHRMVGINSIQYLGNTLTTSRRRFIIRIIGDPVGWGHIITIYQGNDDCEIGDHSNKCNILSALICICSNGETSKRKAIVRSIKHIKTQSASIIINLTILNKQSWKKYFNRSITIKHEFDLQLSPSQITEIIAPTWSRL